MGNSAINGAQLKQNISRPTGASAESRSEEGFHVPFALIAALIIVLAAILRLGHISRYEIWLDEAYCFAVAKGSMSEIIQALRLDNGPPLYYMMLHFWMRMFRESPFALRSLSALFSIASVAVVLMWKTPWLSRRARITAGFIFAITPLALYYAQEARMYSPVMFFSLLSIVFLERGLRAGGIRDWCALSLSTALALYTSYIAIFLVPVGYFAALLAFHRERKTALLTRRVRCMLAAHAAAGVLFLPWLPIFINQPREVATQWIARMPGRPHPAVMPLQSLLVMTPGGARYPSYLRQLRWDIARYDATVDAIEDGLEDRAVVKILASVHPNLMLAVAVLFTLAALSLALNRPADNFPARALLVSWLLLPIAAPLVLSLRHPMYLVGRYEITALPAMAILAGIGISRFRPPWRAVALVAAGVLAFYSWGWALTFPGRGRQPERGALVAQTARRGDVILALLFEYAPIYYYMGAERDRSEFVTYPRDTIEHSAWIDYERWLKPANDYEVTRNELREEAHLTVAETAGRMTPGSRLIIVRPRRPIPQWGVAMEAPLIAAVEALVPDTLLLHPTHSRPDMGILVFEKALTAPSMSP